MNISKPQHERRLLLMAVTFAALMVAVFVSLNENRDAHRHLNRVEAFASAMCQSTAASRLEGRRRYIAQVTVANALTAFLKQEARVRAVAAKEHAGLPRKLDLATAAVARRQRRLVIVVVRNTRDLPPINCAKLGALASK